MPEKYVPDLPSAAYAEKLHEPSTHLLHLPMFYSCYLYMQKEK